jgi:membrane protease YdiL (CAAX protease family)
MAVINTTMMMTKMSTPITTPSKRGTLQKRRSRAAAVQVAICGAMLMLMGETQAFQQVSLPTKFNIPSRARAAGSDTSLFFRGPPTHSNLIQRPRQRQHRSYGSGVWSNAVADIYDDSDNANSDFSQNSSKNNNSKSKKLTNPLRKFSQALFRILHATSRQHPLLQMVVALALYTFHLTVLTQHAVVFPFQLIPTTMSTSTYSLSAAGTGIGWDSLAGMATLGLYAIYKRQQQGVETSSETAQTKKTRVFPWQLPAHNNRHKLSFLIASCLLTQAYFFTGQFSIYWEDLLYNLSGQGWPLTAPMHRSLCVLLGHMSWVVAGSTILWVVPRPPPFFGKILKSKIPNVSMNEEAPPKEASDESSSSAVNESASKASPNNSNMYYSWFRSQWNSKWLWWAIGGYFVSSWLFNVADQVNQCILPAQVLQQAQESVVSQLVNPEHNDFAASVVGYIAPCLTAPVWEEVLYRGFALAGLTTWTGSLHVAAVIQAVIFSAHHMSVTAALPLFVLGWTWAMLYAESRNLFTVIFVHALWNSRVFLGSWLGL